MGDIFLMPPPGMIGMAMGDNGFVNRLPRIEIYVRLCTINSVVVKSEQGFPHAVF